MLVATGTPPTTSSEQIGGVYEFFENGVFTALPTYGVYATGGQVSFAPWNRGTHNRLYMCGGHSANAVLSETRMVTAFNLPKFTEQLVDSGSPAAGQIGVQSSGTGLTGNAIIYLRRSESSTGRRSMLSGGVAKTLANNGLAFSNVPTSLISSYPLFDTVEVWVSLDGGLPRHLASRDAGVATFTVNETILGEAEITGSIDFPTCKYAVIYHDRLVMAGNKEEPSKVFFSDIGDPEVYTGLNISTKNGERIIGLFVIRDILVIQCEETHYYVQGFDEDDITLNVLSPSIGGLGHHTVSKIPGDLVFVPSKSGLYVCNGTSMIEIGDGAFGYTWRSEQHWGTKSGTTNFTFSVSDTEYSVIRYLAPNQSSLYSIPGIIQDTGVESIYWVIDYSALVKGGEAKLMFDTTSGTTTASTNPTASAMLTGVSGDKKLYTGTAAGKIVVENVHGKNDLGDTVKFMFHSPQIELAAPGDDSDAANIIKLWLLMQNEDIAVDWTLFAGNQYDWQSIRARATDTGGRAIGGQVAAGADVLGFASRVYRDRVLIHPERSSGSTASVMLVSNLTGQSTEPHPYYLNAPLQSDGTVFSAPLLTIRGWGITFVPFGVDPRSIRSIPL